MFGKLFASMYQGSMYGSGPDVLAVWPWVIANANIDGRVEINLKRIADTLGMTQEAVAKVVEKFKNPDPQSRSKVENGRKLIQEGEFLYRIVNYDMYRAIRREEDRREQNRIAQANWRESQKFKHIKKSKVSASYREKEKRFVEAVKNGDEAAADSVASEGLQEQAQAYIARLSPAAETV